MIIKAFRWHITKYLDCLCPNKVMHFSNNNIKRYRFINLRVFKTPAVLRFDSKSAGSCNERIWFWLMFFVIFIAQHYIEQVLNSCQPKG